MALWVDCYQPRFLDQLNLHDEITPRLRAIAQTNNFPHLLFSGPAGSGKRTRVSALLREVFQNDPTLDKLKLEHKSVKVTDSKTIEVTALCSSQHMELNLSDLGIYDRSVITTTIKGIAQTVPLPSFTRDKKVLSHSFRVLVLHEVDNLTIPAQQALRRTMEKYAASCRLILVAESTGQIISPIRSRCLQIRVPAPENEKIVEIMISILRQERESIVELTEKLKKEILDLSNRNIRRALLLLEASWRNKKKIQIPPWQITVRSIAQCIKAEQTPKQVFDVRNMFYDLLGACIPPHIILQELLFTLLKIPGSWERKRLLTHYGAVYDHTLRLGSKPIFHLEAFVVHAMGVYKSHELNLPLDSCFME